MNTLFSNKIDVELLQKAWDLDQEALFDVDKKKQKKLWTDALTICRKLLRKYKERYPENFQIISKIALIYLHQNKFKSAKKYLDIANCKIKNDPIILFNYGNLYRAMNNPGLAIKYYEKAIKHSHQDDIFKEELKRYKKILKKRI